MKLDVSGRLPAHNIEAEQGLLGSLLLDNDTIPEVRRILAGEEDFYRDAHQILYRAVCDLHDAGRPVDAITVVEELRRRDRIDDVDEDFLCEVLASVPHAANAPYYASIVREKAVARGLELGALELLEKVRSNDFTAAQLIAINRGHVDEAETSSPTWDEPDLEALPAVAPFPLEVFPEGLARLVAEAAETFPCPPDFLAVPCLAAASVAIGRSVALAVKDSWVESASLYLAFCAAPGSIKSEALRVAVNPLFELQRKELHGYLVEREVVREQNRLRKAAGGGNGGEDRPNPPRRVLVDDSTTERLAELLAENPRGLLMAADELTAWIGGMNQYKSGGNDRQFYLKVWSGASITRDRKSQEDGVPIVVAHPFLSIVGAITPEMLGILNGDGSDDGFLDRILFSFPDPVRVRFSREPISAGPLADWADALERLFQRPMTADAIGGHRPFYVRFTEQALREYGAWFDRHCDETLEADFASYLRGPWAKMRGYCARFALVLDGLAWAYDPVGPELPPHVGVNAVRRAIAVIDYFKAHARRCQHAIRGEAGDAPDARAVLEWARNRESPRFTAKEARDCFRRRFAARPTGLADSLSWLEQRRAVRKLAAVPRPRGGRIGSDAYEVHPSLRKRARETRETTSD